MNRSLVVGIVVGIACGAFALLISYMFALTKSSMVAIALFSVIFGTFGGIGIGMQFPKIAALSVGRLILLSAVVGGLGIIFFVLLSHAF